MKKILFITSELPPQPGGIGEHAHQLSSYLATYFEVIVLTNQRSANGVEEAEFDKKQAYRVIRVKRRKLLALTYFQRILEAKKYSKDVDLALVSGKFSLWQVWFIKRKRENLPIVGIIHGSELLLSNKKLKKFTDECLEKLDLVISVSKYTQKLVKDLKLKKQLVIPNGVHLSTNKMLSKPKEVSQRLNLITVGNLTQRKGQHNVVEALPILKKLYPNIIYHVVGIPTNQKKLEDLAQQLSVSKHIEIHGRLSDEEKINLLQNSLIFVMLSEQTSEGDVEGFGIAILEANALGLPAIGSKNCGIEDAIVDGYSGRLVDPHQPKEVAEAVQDIINRYDEYTTQAHLHIKKFDWQIIGDTYLKALRECIDGSAKY